MFPRVDSYMRELKRDELVKRRRYRERKRRQRQRLAQRKRDAEDFKKTLREAQEHEDWVDECRRIAGY